MHVCSVYGIFTYSVSFYGEMLVNILYMEPMGYVHNFYNNSINNN